MPTIYRYIGFIFKFFTNEHLPVHLHVVKQDRETKIEIEYVENKLKLTAKKLKSKKPLSPAEIKTAKEFITKYHLQIVRKWNQVYIFKKPVSCETITKKIL